MHEENIENDDKLENEETENIEKGVALPNDDESTHHLSGMFRNWFLDYASYVNLERAVPHLSDGLKPVQRRVLHAMRRAEDGRYNKVAGIVGDTMHFHPHGNSSIEEALVTLGQKNLLIDTQGNWGNILTGDSAAAGRYIEARLSKFALEVAFNNKTTDWKLSYDGRNEEPIALPVKFPLLLAQGTLGIGVGLSSYILPHNFNEIIDAAIAYLEEREFQLYPDFQTGGSIDVSKYNDGERGGSVKVRAKIEKIDNKTLVIREIPFGTNTKDVIASIINANDKGKIKIKKVDDNTSREVEILVHLQPGVSSDKTIDALYAFTNCEVKISPICCVVENHTPVFLSVSQILKYSTDNTKRLLTKELEIEKNELLEKLFYMSLEKIFIQERIYKDKAFEESKSKEAAIAHIDKRIEPFKKDFIREVTNDDLLKLLELRMARILTYNADQVEEDFLKLNDAVKEINFHLEHIVDYTITWFKGLQARYGKDFPRRTEIRNLETIKATKVIEANEKLYINREEGFIGTSLKKDEFIANCSEIDDVIIFYKSGKYKITKVSDKKSVGKDIIYVNIFKKNDTRTIYNVIYRDGKTSITYMKRFAATGLTRDKEYDLTRGIEGSKVLYFTANPNGEAEVVHVTLKPKLRLKIPAFDKNFGDIAIKGRQAAGNIFCRNEILKISLKQKGLSTLGGRSVWFDRDILRINYDNHGEFLGEFQPNDQILVICKNGTFYTTSFDESNHFPDDLMIIEKFDSHKIWSVALFDGEQGYYYIKRFQMEQSKNKINFIGENEKSRMVLISCQVYPRFEVKFGGNDAHRGKIEIDVDEFIGVKSSKAKGKRIHTWEIAQITELEPTRFPDPEPETPTEAIIEDEEDNVEEEKPMVERDDYEPPTYDENTGQMSLF